MKMFINSVLHNLDQDNIEDSQFRWEYLKYEKRKFSIHFSKDIVQNVKTERTYLKIKRKTLEISTNFVNNPEFAETNEKLGKIYQEKKMVLELQISVIIMSAEKNLQDFF